MLVHCPTSWWCPGLVQAPTWVPSPTLGGATEVSVSSIGQLGHRRAPVDVEAGVHRFGVGFVLPRAVVARELDAAIRRPATGSRRSGPCRRARRRVGLPVGDERRVGAGFDERLARQHLGRLRFGRDHVGDQRVGRRVARPPLRRTALRGPMHPSRPASSRRCLPRTRVAQRGRRRAESVAASRSYPKTSRRSVGSAWHAGRRAPSPSGREPWRMATSIGGASAARPNAVARRRTRRPASTSSTAALGRRADRNPDQGASAKGSSVNVPVGSARRSGSGADGSPSGRGSGSRASSSNTSTLWPLRRIERRIEWRIEERDRRLPGTSGPARAEDGGDDRCALAADGSASRCEHRRGLGGGQRLRLCRGRPGARVIIARRRSRLVGCDVAAPPGASARCSRACRPSAAAIASSSRSFTGMRLPGGSACSLCSVPRYGVIPGVLLVLAQLGDRVADAGRGPAREDELLRGGARHQFGDVDAARTGEHPEVALGDRDLAALVRDELAPAQAGAPCHFRQRQALLAANGPQLLAQLLG